jgi:outer membrane protein assembly factor BamB
MTRFAAILAGILLAVPAHAGDWLHFRGPSQNGVAMDTGLPDKWSPAKEGENNLVWKQPFGGRSTPVIVNGRVCIINGVNPSSISEQERVMCLDAKTGKQLWEHKFNIFHTDIVTNRVGWANLAADAETGFVYAHGIQGLFLCLDSKDGKVVWSRSLTEEFGRAAGGYGGRVASPIVDEDLVIIHFINASWGNLGRGGHRFLAMDKKTGEVRWWSEPGGQQHDAIYSVPVVATINHQRLLICGGADGAIHAMQVRTGKHVWSHVMSKRGINVSPVVEGNFVYITHSEENVDEGVQGLVICLDASKVTNGEPTVVWKKTGVLAGYASPIIHEGRLYVPDNSAKLLCYNAKTGDLLWEHRYGTVAKASPVWGDGKIYVGEVTSKFHILQPGDKECKTLNTVRFPAGPTGEVREINGSPVIADARLYFTTEDTFYCIGTPQGRAAANPASAAAEPKTPVLEVSQVLVTPGEVVIAPGQTVTFKARCYDANGRFVDECEAAEWSLPLPPTPPGGKPPGQPPALKGEIQKGKFTADSQTRAQAAYVEAKVGKATALARVRVVPPMPLSIDFDKLPTGGVPAGWINAGGKFIIVEGENGNKMLKKRADNSQSPLARAMTFFYPPSLSDYTIEADLMGTQKGSYRPTLGVINSRYMLWIDGMKNRLWVSSWEANKRIENMATFKLKPGQWYTFKLDVHLEGGKGIAQGKVWPRGEKEPAEWMVRIEDPIPNKEGSPGLYGYAYGIPPDPERAVKEPGTEVFYDNVKVTANKK